MSSNGSALLRSLPAGLQADWVDYCKTRGTAPETAPGRCEVFVAGAIATSARERKQVLNWFMGMAAARRARMAVADGYVRARAQVEAELLDSLEEILRERPELVYRDAQS